MKFLKKLFLGLVALVAILVVVSFFLPKEVTVERAITIRADAGTVFGQVNSLKEFHEWSPWSKYDPGMEVSFSGPDEGVGATMTWSSDEPNVGSGRQEITESRPNEYVKTQLDFGDQGTGTADFRLNTDEEADRTRVTWGFNTDLGYNPIARYMGLMFDKWIGAEYEDGLANLKERVESMPAPEPEPEPMPEPTTSNDSSSTMSSDSNSSGTMPSDNSSSGDASSNDSSDTTTTPSSE